MSKDLEHITRLVMLTSGNMFGMMREVEFLLPDNADRAEFHARLAVTIFTHAYTYTVAAEGLARDEMYSGAQMKRAQAMVANMLRDAADVVDAGKSQTSRIVKC